MDDQRELDRAVIHAELERSRATFHALVATTSHEELSRRTAGTRWTNQQMLFHIFGRLPESFSRTFAAALNSTTRPFHTVNYLGSCGGAMVFRGPRLTAKLDKTIASLHRHLDNETEKALRGRMHFPVEWDPFFQDSMTLYDLYRYGTQHFDYHQRQLTIAHDDTQT